MTYTDTDDLARQLFQHYVIEYAADHQIDATAGSGPMVYDKLRQHLQDAASRGSIPPSYDSEFSGEPGAHYELVSPGRLDEVTANVKKLTEEMVRQAQEAGQRGEDPNRLHEWSLGKALDKLCPLFPFC